MAHDIKPKLVALGDPTVAAGASMLDIGVSPRVVRSEDHKKKMGKDAFGNSQLDTNVYLGTAGTVAVDVPRDVATSIKTFVSAFKADGTFRTPGESVPRRSLAIIDPDHIAGAATDEHTVWYHAIDDVEIGDLENNTEESDAAEETYVTVTFMFGYVTTAQDDAVIAPELQPYCNGDQLGALAYTLPARYAAA